MAGFRIEGNTSGNVAEVDSSNNFLVTTPGYDSSGVAVGGGDVNGQATFSEVDAGTKTGARAVLSPEVDKDYRLRVAHDNLMDEEKFTDTAQNTGKFTHTFTTLTATSSTAGLLTNSGNITTTTTGMSFSSFQMSSVRGTETLVCETSIAFSAQPNANTIIDFGLFIRGAANPFTPADGAYFRMNSSGLIGVVNNNGTETTTSPFPLEGGTGTWAYTNNAVNKYLIQINNSSTTFWINNYLFAEIITPAGLNFPCMARALPWSVRHVITGGAAGAATQALIKDYRVFLRGPQYTDPLGTVQNRVLGAYQGLSGGTMGSLATYPNSTNPTAAAPSNTALTANLPGGLGGQGLVTAAVAAATDGIWGSYQIPAGTATVQGRRLKLSGVTISCVNTGAAVATTATLVQFSLAFGHTAVSLATAETASFATATTKASRRVALGHATWPIGAAIGAQPQSGPITVDFSNGPIYVNPGEFIQLVGKFLVGTATASQTIAFTWQPIYTWE
jgi:hypothetical protein